MQKLLLASTASSSEEYSEDMHHQNVFGNKLAPDNDSLISFMDETIEEGNKRSLTYLLSFERPVLEWQG